MSNYASGALASLARRNPIPRFGRGLSRARRDHQPASLADDLVFYRHDPLGFDDPDLELCTWPDMIDQRRIGDPALGRFWNDDSEQDDGI